MRTLYSQYMQLSKARLNALVLATTAVGYLLASGGPVRWGGLALTLLGTGLAAIGAAALNQVLEAERDGRMERTRGRPLASGQISKMHGTIFALACIGAGLAILVDWVDPIAAGLGMLNVLVYAAIYTPLKPVTSLNTIVGAVCGALPPMMGWAAASGELSIGAWLLGAILFVWQIPHFLALAWLYRADYARGGFRMLPVIDPTGRLTCLMIVLYSLALLPLGIAVSAAGVAGWVFAAGSVALGSGLLLLGVKLSREKTRENARRVFLASVTYLPLLLSLMVADGRTSPAARVRPEAGGISQAGAVQHAHLP